MHVRSTLWMLEEVGLLIALALPTAIECLTDGLQLKLSNVFIGRASTKNVTTLLSAMFIQLLP